jgi:hypothetical protein
MSIDTIENELLLNEFEKKLGENEHKDLLISILNSRLNGDFDITAIHTEDFISFNFKNKLNEEQISVLDTFGEYYYSKPLINLNYMNIVGPIIAEIARNYTSIKNFMKIKPTNFKQCILNVHKYSNNQDKFNKLLEFSLFCNKVKIFELEFVKTYKHMLPSDFKFSNLIDIDKLTRANNIISFTNCFHIIEDYIGSIYRKNLTEALIPELLNKKTVLNRLFWIVYADDFKFIDNIQRHYLIDVECFEEFEEQIYECSNFNTENSIMMEDGSIQVTNSNVLELWVEQMIRMENNVINLLEEIEQTYDNTIENQIVKNRLKEELENYLRINVKDDEEYEMYKSFFQLNIEIIMFGRSLTKLEEVVSIVTTNNK